MKFGLIGEVLGHSLSPVIHEKIFAALGIGGSYELIEIPRGALADAMPRLALLDGFNVTIPYKTDIIPFLDEISPEAARIGAVNTVYKKDGRLCGTNTDYIGFARTLERLGAGSGDAVLLGTGGAARALLQCIADRGASGISVVSRHPADVPDTFRRFAEERGARIVSYEDIEKGTGAHLLVNATPCGMHPKTGVSPISAALAAKFENVVDIIYNPKETKLLADARAAGAKTANGMYMLVGQAVAAEEVWLGRSIAADVSEAVAREMEDFL